MILNAKALLSRNPKPDEEEIRKAISGVLCRCTGYQKIVQAVQNGGRKAEEMGQFLERIEDTGMRNKTKTNSSTGSNQGNI